MRMTVYAFSSFLSFAITIVVLVRLIIDRDHSAKSKMFIVSVALTALLMLFFGAADLLEEFDTTPIPYIAFLLVIIASCLALHQRCIYCLEVMRYKGPDAKYLRFGLLMLYFGVAVFAIAAVASTGFKDNIIFSIVDKNFKAERFWFIVYGVFFFPAIALSIAALFSAGQKKNYANREDCIYCAIYLLSAVLPIIYVSPIDLTSLFGAFFTLIYYTSHLRSQVTMDAVTHISNRTLIIKRLNTSIGLKGHYFFLVTVDGFKKINDAYGYSEGDQALVRIADTLKNVAPRNIVVGRLSSGKFAMLGEMSGDEAANKLCLEIYDSLKKKNGREDKEWKVTVSIGYINLGTEGLETVPDTIKAAEESQNNMKEAHKAFK